MYAPLSTLILDIWLIRSLCELRGLEGGMGTVSGYVVLS